MNKLHEIQVYVHNRSRFTPEALTLVDNIHHTEAIITTETEQDFADRIADDVRSLNDGKIDGLEIRLTCLEDLPFKEFGYMDFTEDNINV